MKKKDLARNWHMKFYLKLCFLNLSLAISSLLFCSLNNINYDKSFAHEIIDSGIFTNVTDISYSISQKEIGSISYTKMPLLNYYVIHSFYIKPEFRNHGHGHELILYLFNYLKAMGATRVYIQPGPFEMGPNFSFSQKAYEENTQKLIKLYKSVGFDFVGKISSNLAYILYYFMSLKENSNYLMVKKL